MTRGWVRAVVEICRRNRWVLGLGLLAGLFGGATLDAVRKPVYRAEARLELPSGPSTSAPAELAFLADAGLRGTVLHHAARGLDAAAIEPSWPSFPFSLSRIVGMAAAETRDADPESTARVSELRGSLDVSANGEARTITVHYDHHEAEHAASIANAIASALIVYQAADREKRRVEAERLKLESDYADLVPVFASDHADMRALRIQIASFDRRLETLDRNLGVAEVSASDVDTLRFVDPALPATARRIENGSNLLPSVLIALSVAGMGIARREMGGPPTATAGEIGAAFGLPVLGEIEMPGALPETTPLLFVTGRDAEQGTKFARCLAGRLATGGLRTLLIDGDLARPSLHTSYKVPNARGLTSLMAGSVTRSSFPHLFGRVGRNLWLLPTGPGFSGAQTQGRRSIESIYALLEKSFDRIVVVAPLPGTVDGATSWTERGKTILVLSSQEGWRENGTHALGQLARQGTPVIAVALSPAAEAHRRTAAGSIATPKHPAVAMAGTPYDWRPRHRLSRRLAKVALASVIRTMRRERQA